MKVPDQSDIVSLVEMTASSSAITISTHIRPDGDAVGSSVAMLHFLLAQGKDAYVILPHHAPAGHTSQTGQLVQNKRQIFLTGSHVILPSSAAAAAGCTS